MTRSAPTISVTAALLLIVPFAPGPSHAAASRLTVPTQFSTIQSAIDAAHPGDTIRILPGTYVEQLTIAKDLNIAGSGAGSTRIAAPAVLAPRQVNPRPGRAVMVEIFNGASVRMERLAIAGPSETSCFSISPPGGLAGFSVQEGATLALDSAAISGCTREAMLVSHNTLEDNRFFGMVLVDGDHTSSHDKISGGNVGVAVVAISVDTVGTLLHDKIAGAQTPVQELSCCGVTAEAVVIH